MQVLRWSSILVRTRILNQILEWLWVTSWTLYSCSVKLRTNHLHLLTCPDFVSLLHSNLSPCFYNQIIRFCLCQFLSLATVMIVYNFLLAQYLLTNHIPWFVFLRPPKLLLLLTTSLAILAGFMFLVYSSLWTDSNRWSLQMIEFSILFILASKLFQLRRNVFEHLWLI